jgi:MFS superfamily sulfate permease-like transporter
LKKSLDSLPRGKKIILDFSNANLVDHTVLENLHHYSRDYKNGGGSFEILGLEKLKSLSSHELSAKKRI